MARWRSTKRPPENGREIEIKHQDGVSRGIYGISSKTFFILTSYSNSAKVAKGVSGWREV